MWALLTVYQAIRHVMVTAVETRPGTDPDRAGFTTALEAARDTVTSATGILPNREDSTADLVGHRRGRARRPTTTPPAALQRAHRQVRHLPIPHLEPPHRHPAPDLHHHHRDRYHRDPTGPAHTTASTSPNPTATTHPDHARQTTPTRSYDTQARPDQTAGHDPPTQPLADHRGHPAPD
jgi:hypothetical protein